MRQDAVSELKCSFLEPGSWPSLFLLILLLVAKASAPTFWVICESVGLFVLRLYDRDLTILTSRYVTGKSDLVCLRLTVLPFNHRKEEISRCNVYQHHELHRFEAT